MTFFTKRKDNIIFFIFLILFLLSLICISLPINQNISSLNNNKVKNFGIPIEQNIQNSHARIEIDENISNPSNTPNIPNIPKKPKISKSAEEFQINKLDDIEFNPLQNQDSSNLISMENNDWDDESNFLDSCFVDRFKKIPTKWAITKFYFSQLILFLFIIITPIHFIKQNKNSVNIIYKLLFHLSFYFTSYLWCWMLKNALNDINCSRSANSVSGHTMLFIYSILVWFRVNMYGGIWSFLLWLLMSLSVLYDTYFLGFHSLRQMIYGATIGFLFFIVAQFSLLIGAEQRKLAKHVNNSNTSLSNNDIDIKIYSKKKFNDYYFTNSLIIHTVFAMLTLFVLFIGTLYIPKLWISNHVLMCIVLLVSLIIFEWKFFANGQKIISI